MGEATPAPAPNGRWLTGYLEGDPSAMRQAIADDLVESKALKRSTASAYASLIMRAEHQLRARGTTVLTASDDELARFAMSLSPDNRKRMGQALHHLCDLGGRRAALPAILRGPCASSAAHRPGEPHRGHAWDRDKGPAGDRLRRMADHLSAQGLSERSRTQYLRTAWQAEQKAAQLGTQFDEFDAGQLRDYAETLTLPSRRQLRKVVVHYRAALGLSDIRRAVRLPPRPRLQSRALSDREARLVFDAALRDGGTAGAATLLGLLIGLRCSEIAKVRLRDFENDGRDLRVIGKGEVEAVLPVDPILWSYVRLLGSTDFLFPGSRGRGHVTTATIWNWIRDLGAGVGVKVSPHVLRHTCLTLANDGTHDLRAAQDLGRHADPATTAGYTRLTRKRLDGAAGAVVAALTSDVEVPEPTMGLSELVSFLDGADPSRLVQWRRLSDVLSPRPDWRLRLTGDGFGTLHFGRPGFWAIAGADGFTMFRADDDDFISWWDFAEIESFTVALSAFEVGGELPPPSGECSLELESQGLSAPETTSVFRRVLTRIGPPPAVCL